jgi:uncharacterized protein YutE (UPF0331/DUF86 family)
MRLKDKISELERMLSEFEAIKPGTFREYLDNKTKAACERYFERITEAEVELAVLLIKEFRLTMPETEKNSFDSLAAAGIIEAALASKLKQAKGMRNIIAHEYGSVDDEVVYQSITEELVGDTREFLKAAKKHTKG